MKTIIPIITLIAASTLKAEVSLPTNINFINTNNLLYKDGGKRIIPTTGIGYWNVSSDSSWVTFDKTNGVGGEPLRINVAPNSGKLRQANVTMISYEAGAYNTLAVIKPVLSYRMNGNFIPLIGSDFSSSLPQVYKIDKQVSTNYNTKPAVRGNYSTALGGSGVGGSTGFVANEVISNSLPSASAIPCFKTTITKNRGIVIPTSWNVDYFINSATNRVLSLIDKSGEFTITNSFINPSNFGISYGTRVIGIPGVSLLNIGLKYNVYIPDQLPRSGVTNISPGSNRFGSSNGGYKVSTNSVIAIAGLNKSFSSTNASYNIWLQCSQLPSGTNTSKIFDLSVYSTDSTGFSNFNILSSTVSASLGSKGELLIGDGKWTNVFPRIITDSGWHMITVTAIHGKWLDIYLDGLSVGGTSDFKNYVFGNGAGITSVLRMGGWIGGIDQLEFYNGALTAANIRDIYKQQRLKKDSFKIWQNQ